MYPLKTGIAKKNQWGIGFRPTICQKPDSNSNGRPKASTRWTPNLGMGQNLGHANKKWRNMLFFDVFWSLTPKKTDNVTSKILLNYGWWSNFPIFLEVTIGRQSWNFCGDCRNSCMSCGPWHLGLRGVWRVHPKDITRDIWGHDNLRLWWEDSCEISWNIAIYLYIYIYL
jgi:hypothetical protein